MDMTGFALAIVTVAVTLAWLFLGHDLNEQSKLPRSPKEDWHPSWRNHGGDDHGM